MPKGVKKASVKKKASRNTTPKSAESQLVNAAQSSGSLSSSWRLFKQSVSLLWLHKKLFAAVLAIIGAAQLVVVEGIVRTDFVSINKQVQEALGGHQYSLENGVVSYAYLLGSGGQAGGAGVAQAIFVVVMMLALIWVLREITAGNQPRIRDAFYKSMSPLVPYILVLLWLGLQLIPLLVGASIFSIVTTNGIAVHMYEYVLWLGLFFGFAAVSVRLILGTLFALFAVTLPDMTPWAAIQAGRTLVHGRRWVVLRKLVILASMLAVGITAIMLAAIILMPVVVPILFYVVGLLTSALSVTYMYKLYKELL